MWGLRALCLGGLRSLGVVGCEGGEEEGEGVAFKELEW